MTDSSDGWIFNKQVDLTEEFFRYLETHSTKSNIKRCEWNTAVLDKNTLEVLPKSYTSDLENELPFVVKASKVGYVDETELEDRDSVFNMVLEFMGNISHKCIYIREVKWHHLAHQDFCPRPGIIVRYFAFV